MNRINEQTPSVSPPVASDAGERIRTRNPVTWTNHRGNAVLRLPATGRVRTITQVRTEIRNPLEVEFNYPSGLCWCICLVRTMTHLFADCKWMQRQPESILLEEFKAWGWWICGDPPSPDHMVINVNVASRSYKFNEKLSATMNGWACPTESKHRLNHMLHMQRTDTQTLNRDLHCKK